MVLAQPSWLGHCFNLLWNLCLPGSDGLVAVRRRQFAAWSLYPCAALAGVFCILWVAWCCLQLAWHILNRDWLRLQIIVLPYIAFIHCRASRFVPGQLPPQSTLLLANVALVFFPRRSTKSRQGSFRSFPWSIWGIRDFVAQQNRNTFAFSSDLYEMRGSTDLLLFFFFSTNGRSIVWCTSN